MRIENAFTVPAPPDRLWARLLDVERVAPCLPGARLTETVDARTWKGTVGVKLGPVSLSFAGTVTMLERDDDVHRLVLKATGTEQRGKGAATAIVTSWLEPAEGGTRVATETDLTLTGTVAQLSRGLLPEVSRKLTDEFAGCMRASMLAAEEPSAGPRADQPPADVAHAPVRGFRLVLSALWARIRRSFRRGART